jgi:hypothetical protein
MHAGLSVLQAALDAAPAPVPFFLRDDDAGWDDPRLMALLGCSQRANVPIDLAVIPKAADATLAFMLCTRMNDAPGLIGVHQHGFAHTNHETTGRKCEFGNARDADTQRSDLREGRARLLDLFGARLEAIFTPPWNRCSAATPALLAELGFAALSRSRGAPAQHTLPELPVDVDWCKQRRLAAAVGADGLEHICLELARRVSAGGPVGLMLHHAEMNAPDLELLHSVLALTKNHPRARWLPMRALLPVTSGPTASLQDFS